MLVLNEISETGHVSLTEETHDAIKILVTGDLCPLARVEKDLLQTSAEDIFGDILPQLHDKDFSITNLEIALTSGEEVIDKSGPCLRVNPAIMAELRKTKFDLYSVANNHARDYGDSSFLETLKHIKNNNAQYVGGGHNATSAAVPFKVEIKGVKFAIFSICMHSDCDAGENTPGVNALNLPYNTIDVMRAAQDGYKPIVIFHDGKEFIPFPSSRIRNYCRAFVDAGACAVIGHHPHIIRGMEIYKDSLIAYSLGNFLFPQRDGTSMPDPFWFRGFSIRLLISPSGLAGFDVIPHEYDQKTGLLGGMKNESRHRFFENINRLNKILETDNERYFAADCERLIYYGEEIKHFGENLLNKTCGDKDQKIYAKLFNHYITCDEHWDVLKSISYRVWHDISDVPKGYNELMLSLGRTN